MLMTLSSFVVAFPDERTTTSDRSNFSTRTEQSNRDAQSYPSGSESGEPTDVARLNNERFYTNNSMYFSTIRMITSSI